MNKRFEFKDFQDISNEIRSIINSNNCQHFTHNRMSSSYKPIHPCNAIFQNPKYFKLDSPSCHFRKAIFKYISSINVEDGKSRIDKNPPLDEIDFHLKNYCHNLGLSIYKITIKATLDVNIFSKCSYFKEISKELNGNFLNYQVEISAYILRDNAKNKVSGLGSIVIKFLEGERIE